MQQNNPATKEGKIRYKASSVYTSLFHVHLLRLSLLLHLFALLLLGLWLLLGWGRRGRGSGRRRGGLAHDLLDLVVDFTGLVLNLLGSDH